MRSRRPFRRRLSFFVFLSCFGSTPMVGKTARALAAPSGFALTRSANPIASRRAHSATTPARFAHLNLRHVAFPRFYSWRKRPPDLLCRRQLKTHSGTIAGCSGWRALSLSRSVNAPAPKASGWPRAKPEPRSGRKSPRVGPFPTIGVFLFVELRGVVAAEPLRNRAPQS